jgi:DNA polymerase IV
MNESLIENLSILARYYKKVGDKWRHQAYQRSIISIKGLDYKITDINQMKGVKGIGQSIKEKIKEYLDNGQIQRVEEVKGHLKQKLHKNSKETVLELFRGVWGVGPVKAVELYAAGMRNLDDVRENQGLLTANQRIGIKYYQELLKPIPRDYIDVFQVDVHAVLAREFGLRSFKMKVAGSYRRGAKQSGDIDCLITSKKFNLKQMIDALVKWRIVTDILSMKGEKFMGIAHFPNGQLYHFRMDVEFLPEDEWGSGLLYFTGSEGFNIAMRRDAKKMGLILNQHGLFDLNGNRIPVFTENELMDAVGMKYVLPKNR